MAEELTKGFMLAAPKSGSGKTITTITILQLLKNKGLKISAFKCGPDYIDPMFHRKVLGIASQNLDTFFTDAKTTRELYDRASKNSDAAVVEGVMGYFDGIGGVTSKASSYELADTLDIPVILIVDAKGMSLSIAALINGFKEFEGNKAHIKGVILNRTTEGMYRLIKPVLEDKCNITVCGYIPQMKEAVIESRHLGLVGADEILQLENQIQQMADICKSTIDIDAVLNIAGKCSRHKDNMQEVAEGNTGQTSEPVVKIAVARDSAFCFYYDENLRLLEENGCSISYFSPLTDKKLPEGTSGIVLGGGYPELYLEQLSSNKEMLTEIKTAVSDKKIPCIAECGGFMYLLEVMEDMNGIAYEMAGVIEGRAMYKGKLSRFGYVELTMEADSIFGSAGVKLKGHEFHYYDTTNNGSDAEAKKPYSGKTYKCMQVKDNLIAGFVHGYWQSNPNIVKEFVKSCRNAEKNRKK